MQINQTSALSRLSQLQNILGNNSTATSTDSTSSFGSVLESVIKNTSSQGSQDAISSITGTDNSIDSVTGSKETNAQKGLDMLAIQSQQMQQVLQLMNSQGSSLDSDGSGDGEDDSMSIPDISGGNGNMSEMLQTMMSKIQDQNKSSYDSASTNLISAVLGNNKSAETSALNSSGE